MKHTFLAPCGLPNRKVNIVPALLLLLLLYVVAGAVCCGGDLFVAVLFICYLIESLSCDRNMAALETSCVFFLN
jgi:hypothetical protein